LIIYSVRIRIEYRTKIKIISVSSVETGVLRQKPLQAKLIADYFSLSQSIYLQGLQRLLTSGNAYWRGRLSTVDLLIKVACFVKSR
jgi:hypothetical protein